MRCERCCSQGWALWCDYERGLAPQGLRVGRNGSATGCCSPRKQLGAAWCPVPAPHRPHPPVPTRLPAAAAQSFALSALECAEMVEALEARADKQFLHDPAKLSTWAGRAGGWTGPC